MASMALHVAGAGLLALDVVVEAQDGSCALTYAGGTCGNVLSILSFLNCSTSAIGYVGDDVAGRRMLGDLRAVGVRAHHVRSSEHYSTPVFVQDLYQDALGRPHHRFGQQCPSCGSVVGKAPGDSRVPITSFVHEEVPQVFFIDRLSEDIVALAASAKACGALVIYEPSAPSDRAYWPTAFEFVDVLKYSADRFRESDFDAALQRRSLSRGIWEIQTLGADGLRYRRHQAHASQYPSWLVSEAFDAPRVVDTCGAGDWCTAGLVYGLFHGDHPGEFARFGSALRLGQAFAAWACAFVGARGAMYCSDATATWQSVNQLVRGESVDVSLVPQAMPSRTHIEDAHFNELGCGRLCPIFRMPEA